MDPLGWTVQASQNLKSTADWCSDANGTELWVSGTYHHFICLLAYFKLLSNTDYAHDELEDVNYHMYTMLMLNDLSLTRKGKLLSMIIWLETSAVVLFKRRDQ